MVVKRAFEMAVCSAVLWVDLRVASWDLKQAVVKVETKVAWKAELLAVETVVCLDALRACDSVAMLAEWLEYVKVGTKAALKAGGMVGLWDWRTSQTVLKKVASSVAVMAVQ